MGTSLVIEPRNRKSWKIYCLCWTNLHRVSISLWIIPTIPHEILSVMLDLDYRSVAGTVLVMSFLVCWQHLPVHHCWRQIIYVITEDLRSVHITTGSMCVFHGPSPHRGHTYEHHWVTKRFLIHVRYVQPVQQCKSMIGFESLVAKRLRCVWLCFCTSFTSSSPLAQQDDRRNIRELLNLT